MQKVYKNKNLVELQVKPDRCVVSCTQFLTRQAASSVADMAATKAEKVHSVKFYIKKTKTYSNVLDRVGTFPNNCFFTARN